MHDDTPALVLAIQYFQALSAKGKTALYAPGGTYNLHNAVPYNNIAAAFDIYGLQNFTFSGDGNATLFNQSADRTDGGTFVTSGCGYPITTCTGSAFALWNNSAAGKYSLVDPVKAGSMAAALVTPSQASVFSSASPTNPVWVNIFNDVSSYPANEWGEMNAVTGANATTGLLTFLYPTDKTYSDSLGPPYNSAADGTPVISPIVGGITARRITFRDFSYYGPNQFTNLNAVAEFTEKSLTVTDTDNDDAGAIQTRTIDDFHGTEDPNDIFPPSLFAIGAAGSSNYTVRNSRDVALRMNSDLQNCSEGTTNVDWTGNSVEVDGSWDGYASGGLIGGSGFCVGLNIANNIFRLRNAGLSYVFHFDPSVVGTMNGNTVDVDTVGVTGSIEGFLGQTSDNFSPYLSVCNNQYIVGSFVSGGGSTQQLGCLSALPSLSTFPIGNVSGSPYIGTAYGTADILSMTLTGNLSSLNLGGNRIPGLQSILAFKQAASGGPYTLPPDCTNSSWNTGNGLNCPNGAPVITTVPGGVTYVPLFDDGIKVNFAPFSPSSSFKVVATVPPTLVSGVTDVGNQVLLSPAGNHEYEACVSLVTTVAESSGTVQLTVAGDSDGVFSAAQVSTGFVSLTSAGAQGNQCGTFYVDTATGNDVVWSLFYTTTTGTPSVRYAITLMQLQ
jgi:hypothetical protein